MEVEGDSIVKGGRRELLELESRGGNGMGGWANSLIRLRMIKHTCRERIFQHVRRGIVH